MAIQVSESIFGIVIFYIWYHLVITVFLPEKKRKPLKKWKKKGWFSIFFFSISGCWQHWKKYNITRLSVKTQRNGNAFIFTFKNKITISFLNLIKRFKRKLYTNAPRARQSQQACRNGKTLLRNIVTILRSVSRIHYYTSILIICAE